MSDATAPESPSPPERDADFDALRPRLLGLAYRMTGSAMDAEDLVQEAWLRWQGAEAAVQNSEAWLVRVTTNLCLDHVRSARVRREAYVGPWLPEPVVGPAGFGMPGVPEVDAAGAVAQAVLADPERHGVLAESLSSAFLVVLERLSPLERAAWLLREAFDYDYAELATMLERSPAACRQLVSRAARHLAAERARFEVADERHLHLATTFLHAAREGDLAPLEAMLTSDAIVISDGGGQVAAALQPIRGPERVARFFAGLAAKAQEDLHVQPARVNGKAGFVVRVPGEAVPFVVLSFHFEGQRIRAVHAMRNPDKLRALTRES